MLWEPDKLETFSWNKYAITKNSLTSLVIIRALLSLQWPASSSVLEEGGSRLSVKDFKEA